jgi:hypothetical protein
MPVSLREIRLAVQPEKAFPCTAEEGFVDVNAR